MNSQRQPRVGPGKFQWNFGSWFGGLLGGTAWLLVGGVLLAAASPRIAAVWIGCFVVVGSIAIALYCKRSIVAPYPALQSLLGLTAVAGVLAWRVLVLLRPDLLPRMQVDALQGYLMLLLFPAIMLGFHIQEMSERR